MCDKTDLELFLDEQKAKARKTFIFWMVAGALLTAFIIFIMFVVFALVGIHITGVV